MRGGSTDSTRDGCAYAWTRSKSRGEGEKGLWTVNVFHLERPSLFTNGVVYPFSVEGRRPYIPLRFFPSPVLVKTKSLSGHELSTSLRWFSIVRWHERSIISKNVHTKVTPEDYCDTPTDYMSTPLSYYLIFSYHRFGTMSTHRLGPKIKSRCRGFRSKVRGSWNDEFHTRSLVLVTAVDLRVTLEPGVGSGRLILRCKIF